MYFVPPGDWTRSERQRNRGRPVHIQNEALALIVAITALTAFSIHHRVASESTPCTGIAVTDSSSWLTFSTVMLCAKLQNMKRTIKSVGNTVTFTIFALRQRRGELREQAGPVGNF